MIKCHKRQVVIITNRFSTNDFSIEYTESTVSSPILWESHCHTKFEMIAVLEGDITVMTEGKSYRLQKSQIIIVPPLSYHAITANSEGVYRRITSLFAINAVPEVLRQDFAKRCKDATIIASSNAEKIKDICQKENTAFYAPLLQGLMTEIFYDTLQTPQHTEKAASDEFLQRALQYIDSHLHEKILLDDLAKYTARSKSSFCHLFEKKMNISPKQYILQKKLAMAKKLIDEGTPHTVAAIQIGYENYSNFYRLYQKSANRSN